MGKKFVNWTKEQYESYLAKSKAAACLVAELPISKPQQNSRQTLVSEAPGKKASRTGIARSRRIEQRALLRIGLVACYNRGPQKDAHDNLPASFKQLADALANWFGCDDSEIEWHYGQVRWPEAGTIVILEQLA